MSKYIQLPTKPAIDLLPPLLGRGVLRDRIVHRRDLVHQVAVDDRLRVVRPERSHGAVPAQTVVESAIDQVAAVGYPVSKQEKKGGVGGRLFGPSGPPPKPRGAHFI